MQFAACLAALDRLCAVEACEVLETLLIYIENIINNPLEKKYRAIRFANVNYQERIGHLNCTLPPF